METSVTRTGREDANDLKLSAATFADNREMQLSKLSKRWSSGHQKRITPSISAKVSTDDTEEQETNDEYVEKEEEESEETTMEEMQQTSTAILNAMRVLEGRIRLNSNDTHELYKLVGISYWNTKLMILVGVCSMFIGMIIGTELKRLH